MKKVLFATILVIAMLNAKAQGVDSAFAIVRYTLTHVSDTTQPENPIKQRFALYLGAEGSMYKYDFSNIGNGPASSVGSVVMSGGSISVSNVSGGNFPAGAEKSSYSNSYYKNPATNKLSYLTIPAFSDKLFDVEEKLNDLNWEIAQDTKSIMGMECQKATARFKGRDYEAWFSTQLPYSNGPWKLGGLPGLIIEVADTKREVVFTMTAFENVTGPKTAISIPDYVIKTSPKEYKQYAEALKRDAAANKGAANAGSGGTISVRGVMSASTVSGVKPRQFNNPIEKE